MFGEVWWLQAGCDGLKDEWSFWVTEERGIGPIDVRSGFPNSDESWPLSGDKRWVTEKRETRVLGATLSDEKRRVRQKREGRSRRVLAEGAVSEVRQRRPGG